uniref:NADH-ubiquinone oxidoreductase chain 6 n=1 Tax=Galerucinae sp. 846596 TaxID=1213610 RepID=A0A0S2MSI7_9CUCU|nr:NADH deshydrogenase subunit 6 [Galerucinae sp. 846596]
MMTLMLLTMLCAILFLLFKHPLTLGMTLISQTILIALITGLMNYNYWFSYILFLIMIGGMLILFLYMTSVASNEKFKFNSKILFMFISTITLSMVLTILDKFYNNFLSKFLDLKINLFYNFSMIKYFNFPNNLLMLMLIIYLFLTLITIVKITNFSQGTLRQKF